MDLRSKRLALESTSSLMEKWQAILLFRAPLRALQGPLGEEIRVTLTQIFAIRTTEQHPDFLTIHEDPAQGQRGTTAA